jgi:type I restriction enzyme M protein
MLNSVLKSSINRLWDKFWSGGISNPLTAIEQISYLLFMKRLDELDIKKKQDLKAIKTIYAGATLSRWKVVKCLSTCKQKFFLFLKH